MGRPFDEVIAIYLRASDAVTSRAEALHAASRLCRENKKFADGFKYARRGLKIPLPADGLFVESWIYDYGLLDEFAVNAYWTERYQDCLEACQRLLREGKMPADMYDRVKKNADFARTKLASRAANSTCEAATIGGTSQVSESEPKRPRLKVILICGPFGSGTSVVAGLLDRMGAFGLGPYLRPTIPKRQTATNPLRSGKLFGTHLDTQASRVSHLLRPYPAPCNPASEACKAHRATGVWTLRFSFFQADIPQISAIGVCNTADLRGL